MSNQLEKPRNRTTISLPVVGGLCVAAGVLAAAAWYYLRRRSTALDVRKAPALMTEGPIRVIEVLVYPIKSCRGISLPTGSLSGGGFTMDRKWMIVDAATGNFVTQRDDPRMATIATAVRDWKYFFSRGRFCYMFHINSFHVGSVFIY